MKVKINFNMKKALIVVDMQNDFCKGGSLEVTDSESIVPYINCLMENKKYDEVFLLKIFTLKSIRVLLQTMVKMWERLSALMEFLKCYG